MHIALQRRGQAEAEQHITHVARRLRAVAQESVGACRSGAANRTRNCEHRPRAAFGFVHRVHGAALLLRFDDDHDVGERGDEPVARREPPALGRRAERCFSEHHATTFELAPQHARAAADR